MKKFLKEMFSDNNSLNEKSIIGGVAFLMLVIALFVDLVTGWLGEPASICLISWRHHCSVVCAIDESEVSSTTSSTSRQKAYSAVIACLRWGGKNKKL